MNHPNYETLINYIEDHLPEAEQAGIDEHLSHSCQECSDKIARLRLVLAAVAEDKNATPPPGVLQRAIAAHREKTASERRPLLRVLAEMLFDSRLQLSPMATRGAAHARQMLFATPQVDIDLSVTPEHQEHHLVGQILDRAQADQYPSAFVSLQNETGSLLRSMETDSLGQFTFRQIPPGTYDLVIDLEDQEVSITGLEFSND